MKLKNHSSLAVFVLNWNQPHNTVECVQSLIEQKGSIQFKLMIIDNGSKDNSVAIFRAKFPQVEVIQNEKNLGFQGGMNTGIKKALQGGFDYVLLLNDDTVAQPDMLEKLILLTPEDAHLVSPGIYYFSDSEYLCSLGTNFNPILLESTQSPRKKYNKPDQTAIKYEFLPSTAWMIKTSVFESIGLMDESFFPLYYDDLDFCFRLKKGGYNLYLIPDAKLLHKVSLSMGGQHSPNERYYMARNSGYYFRKHMDFWNAPFIIIFRVGSAVSWTVRLLGQKNFEGLLKYWQGLMVGWFGKLPRKKKVDIISSKG